MACFNQTQVIKLQCMSNW